MQLTHLKRKILIPLSLLIITSTVLAQPRQGNQGPPPLPNRSQIAEMVEELDDVLELSKGQKAQISALYFAHFEEVKTVQNSGKVSRQEMDELKKHFQAEVKVLLNKNQVKKFESLQKNKPVRQQRGKR